MHHNPLKNVLHIDLSIPRVAKAARIEPAEAVARILSARPKLYAARKLRPTPYIDKTVYVGWNAMMVSAYLEAGRALADGAAATFALKTLDRLLSVAWDGNALGHVVAYGEGKGNWNAGRGWTRRLRIHRQRRTRRLGVHWRAPLLRDRAGLRRSRRHAFLRPPTREASSTPRMTPRSGLEH